MIQMSQASDTGSALSSFSIPDITNNYTDTGADMGGKLPLFAVYPILVFHRSVTNAL
uniref:Uncharacterized protein n=1 Tax=Arundo donax TaxID=35708 RepID=A0A0A9DU35_ARUDO